MSQTLSLPVLSDSNFSTVIAPGSGLVAIEFSAAWCPPCRIMEPIVEAIAKEFAGELTVYQVDNDANPATIARLGVRSLPSLLVFRDGELVDRIVGAVPRPVLRERLEKIMKRQ